MNKNNTEVPEKLRLELAEYINNTREKKKIGFNQLSIKSEVNPGVLTKILNGTNKRINPYQLIKLANALKIDYKELYKIVRYLEEEKPKERIESNIDTSVDYKEIPLYHSISAGLGLESLSSEEVEFIPVPDTKQFSGEVVAIRVDGDSMEYTIENGSIIFVKKGVEVPNKKVGAFIHNNKALLKRYVCLDDQCFLRSDNREYPDIPLQKGDDFEIVGRVIGQIEAVD